MYAQSSLSVAIKATYLYKFAPFVIWPPTAASGPAFVICVVGTDPFGAVLDRAVAGQAMDGHPFEIRRLASARRGAGCQIAYLSGSPIQSVREAELAFRGEPVLTVTDANSDPGIIDFVAYQDRVRFRIDGEAAAQSGLKISSKLLSLALSVNSRTG